jgi:histidinol phosphatase-like PHP family hydrolase
MPAQKALRRASRKALFWPEEAAAMHADGSSLTELAGVGPYLEQAILTWLDDPPETPERPDIRRGFFTLTEARAALARKPAWLRGITGDLQMHSLWSDGEGTIARMAEAAVARGYEYIAITDHSKGLKIAGGIDERQVRKQAAEINELNRQLRGDGRKLRVLKSLEVNLNPRGEVDMEADCLAELDIVLGCFHSSLRTKEDQTARYVAALRNPAIQILGYPDRQDLDIELVRLAKRAGCRISLGTDSHGPSQLGFMEYSAASALAAEIPRERILNFMTCDRLLNWVGRVRDAQAA